MITKPLIFAGTANKPFAKKLAKEIGLKLGNMEIVRFADQETHVILHEDVKNRDVYIIQPTSMPVNETLMELLLMVHAIADFQPKKITAIMPFFGYRRQEKKTMAGEVLSFQLAAKLLKTAGVARILLIDLHKHRSVKYFKEFSIKAKELRAFEMIVDYFTKKKLQNFVVLAPDKGSIPESEKYAKSLNVPLVKVYKRRSIHRRDYAYFHDFQGEVKGKNILIVDDEINTAGTLMGVVDILKKKKARNIYFACTHAILSGKAVKRLQKTCIRQVVITDTIYTPTAKRLKKMKILSVTPLFAKVINQ